MNETPAPLTFPSRNPIILRALSICTEVIMNSSPIYRQINILANRQRRHFDRLTAEAPFSGAQGRVLHYLLDHPDEEIFQKDIEEEFGLRPSTATTLLQSMELKGLLRREPSEKDARYMKLTLTPEAEKHRGALFAEMSQLTEKLAGSIAPDDLKTWQKVTEQMIKNLK